MNVDTLVAKLKGLKPKQVVTNLLYLLRYDLKQSFFDTQTQLIQEYDYKLSLLKQELLYYKIKDYFANHPSDAYAEELHYLSKLGRACVFPYEQTKFLTDVAYGYDEDKQLPYVMHDQRKKLYFPKAWSVEQALIAYSDYVQTENLLGGGFKVKSPHQYASDTVFVEDGDVLVDIGAAEALFSLEHIDKVSKAIIIESDALWCEALHATFEPYADKVKIVNKRISTIDSENEITLGSCLVNEKRGHLFIKMDIEGYETNLLEDSSFSCLKDEVVKVVCCTYHKHNDATQLEYLLTKYGYQTEFSDGYMLFFMDKLIAPPYFRKGLIRALKTSK